MLIGVCVLKRAKTVYAYNITSKYNISYLGVQ